MLSKIRDKMSTWVVGVLLLLVAVPLVFMGLGNYQSSEESYAFKINDQVISTSQLEQEVFQYRQALEKNYQGNLPPLYTNSFIREVTVDYMFRTILLDQASRNSGLVFHNESILNAIYSTPSFRDENGFSKEKYLSQLYRIGMDANSYERYIYQKGITGQLRNSITNTSFLTKNEKSDLIKFRHHIRDVSYMIIDYNDIKEDIELKEKDLQDEYENNLEVYRSPAYAKYLYLDIDKNNLIKNIEVTDEQAMKIYKLNLDEGMYVKPVVYKVNHILIDSEVSAKEALQELKEGLSFKEVSMKHSTDTETLESKGYLGEFILTDLPDYLSSEIINLKINEISKIIKSTKGYHIVSILGKTDDTISSFKDSKDTIIKDYKKEAGTRKYFDLIDDISEINFTKKYRLQELADRFNLKIMSSKYISKDEGHGIFDYEFVRTNIFTEDVITKSKTSDLIYLNGDRFIIVELDDYKNSEQLSYDDSKNIIETLVLNQKTNSAVILNSENIRDDLNAGISDEFNSLSSFVGSIDSTDIDEKIKQLFFNTSPSKGFVAMSLGSKDYMIFSVNEIIYPKNISEIKDVEDYYNFAYNTRSESEFNSFYSLFKANAEVTMNDEYMKRD
ncbi:MAG: SurA N-terminal domain-containing protein [Gammaproteobacteria bacterium]|nr:SurA N-terminal domain-containing protein [Gammaproteobacteria bacterium]|tara:strand:+ start:7217 stop:9064 length:1848 start_codon:yes stop_codon:yes gene_type:complete